MNCFVCGKEIESGAKYTPITNSNLMEKQTRILCNDCLIKVLCETIDEWRQLKCIK